jgi:1-acyl-sn-glycerol-3-phosphate acyltransferase
VYSVVAALLVLLMRLVTGVRAQWVNCEITDRPRIYFANHSSHLDALVIWAALPRNLRVRTRPVAARDYWGQTAIRRYLAQKVFHAVLIDRNNSRMYRELLDTIQISFEQGYSLILFPEGTRGDGVAVGDFKPGIYHLARIRPDLELVPVYLQNLSRILPKGEIFPIPILGSATFGPPIRLEPGEGKETFLTRARSSLSEIGGNP